MVRVTGVRGCVYSKKLGNLDRSFQVSNGISPPKTKMDSLIRDLTWISELVRLNFDRLGRPSWPHFFSQVWQSKFRMRYICARVFVLGVLKYLHCYQRYQLSAFIVVGRHVSTMRNDTTPEGPHQSQYDCPSPSLAISSEIVKAINSSVVFLFNLR